LIQELVARLYGGAMTTSDSDQDKEKPSSADRLEEIKKEEKEDASSYYAQGKGTPTNVKEEFEAPVPPVDKASEDLNLLRAVAFLGFGLAALAIVFILFFIRDLDERVGGMDSAVKKVEESIDPLKTDVEGVKSSIEGNAKSVKAIEESLNTVNDTVAKLQGKFGNYEKTMAIMELKRALAMIKGISAGSDAGVQSKSSEVLASINSLLSELGAGTSNQPAGEIQVEEATEEPAAEEESSEEATEEPAAEEESSEEATEEPAAEEESSEEATEEPAAEEESSEEATEEPAAEEESSEEATEEPAAEEESSEEATEEPAAEEAAHEEAAPAESAGHGDSADSTEELPTVEELLKE
jgi:septal ring factor EnvC (AmiA/AmiB activator)